jgi:hypothetical protein
MPVPARIFCGVRDEAPVARASSGNLSAKAVSVERQRRPHKRVNRAP